MKKFVFILVLLFSALLCFSEESNISPVTILLDGPHPIKYISIYPNTSNKNSEKLITLAWKFNNDYIFSTVSINKIRVRIDESVKIPYIRFKYWDHSNNSISNSQNIIDDCVMYILLICDENYFTSTFK